MANAYLDGLREKFDAAHKTITDVQDRAVEESRDLTEAELRSVTDLGAQGKLIAEQIAPLAEIENRSAQVSKLTANVFGATEVRTSSTSTQDRDPGHYRSESEGGDQSFFADHYRANVLHDQASARRLDEHSRSVNQSPGGAGIVPPKWLTDEYLALGRQHRAVANAVRHIPLGRDPRPMVLPKQTVGSDANILTQAAEGANTSGWGADAFTTAIDTLTPVTKSAYQDVSRQLLDGSTPAVDALIFADLRAAWDQVVEGLVCSAILAGGTATGTTFANEAAFSAAAAAIDAVVDAQTAVAGDLRGPADLAIMNYRRFGAHRKLKDSTGRPLMPVSRYGPQNATGALDNLLVGDIEGVDAIGTAGVPTAYAEKYAVLRRSAVILAESDLLEFSYEQVGGPSSIRMGIWGYVGTLVRNPKSVSVLTVTAA